MLRSTQRWHLCALVPLLLLVREGSGQVAARDVAGLEKKIETLQEQQKVLENDLNLIKKMLLGKQVSTSAAPLQNVTIDMKGAASLGSRDAKVVIVEFTDYQCPFCGRYANETFAKVTRDYVTPGKVQYVLKNFPLQDAHPLATKLAQAAACAGEQGKYWEAHERLFRNQGTETPDLLPRQERALGLNEPEFVSCIDGTVSLMKVKADVDEAKRLNLDATPTFLFGYRDSKDSNQIHAVKMLTGAQPLLAFEQILEYLLDPPAAISQGEN